MIRWLIRRWAIRTFGAAQVDGHVAVAQVALAINDARAEDKSAGRQTHQEEPDE